MTRDVSRRAFLKKSALGSAAVAGMGAVAGVQIPAAEAQELADRYSIVAALGDRWFLPPRTPATRAWKCTTSRPKC